MMPISNSREFLKYFIKKGKFWSLGSRPFFSFFLLCFILFLSFYIFYAPISIKFTPRNDNADHGDGTFGIRGSLNPTPVEKTNFEQINSSIPLQKEKEKCDLFKGRWVPDAEGYSYYTNNSCRTIPYLKNCFLHGRTDTDFLHWRWKPDQCELPRFDPIIFLHMLKGKTMAFIGDSVARNQMESLLCLLSLEETPVEVYKDTESRFQTWHFSNHNFTLMVLWSQFLVTSSEILVNGSATGGFHLHLDKVDRNWAQKLPVMDYAIFSDAHWFFRSHYLYEGGKLIGCVYCTVPNVTDLGPGYALRRAFQLAFKTVNNCKNCREVVTFLRTYSPSHFEHAAWNMGGYCNRTSPVTEEENKIDQWEFRDIQVEEIERAKKNGEKVGNVFDVIDITRAMQLRADAHPGFYWGNKWMKGYNDCIHWCLPGPVDAWNEFLFEILKRQIPVSHWSKRRQSLRSKKDKLF